MRDGIERTDWYRWHGGVASDAEVIRVIEVNSGPSRSMRACKRCQAEHSLTPITSERPEAER